MLERLLHYAVFQCSECGARRTIPRTFFSRFARCPSCLTSNLRIRRSLDKIDGLVRNPVRTLQGWLGAPLLHCHACRLQFYDFRPVRKLSESPSEEKRTSSSSQIA